jgi:hypothetical protein
MASFYEVLFDGPRGGEALEELHISSPLCDGRLDTLTNEEQTSVKCSKNMSGDHLTTYPTFCS